MKELKIICPGCKKDLNPFIKKFGFKASAIHKSWIITHEKPCSVSSKIDKIIEDEIVMKAVYTGLLAPEEESS